MKQLLNPLLVMLLVAGGLTLMAYGIQSPKQITNVYLGVALIITVVFTATMSYLQERSASNVMASLGKMLPAKCHVYRDGKESKIEAFDLVPGDLVRLYIGDRVPADIRILETSDLKVGMHAHRACTRMHAHRACTPCLYQAYNRPPPLAASPN